LIPRVPLPSNNFAVKAYDSTNLQIRMGFGETSLLDFPHESKVKRAASARAANAVNRCAYRNIDVTTGTKTHCKNLNAITRQSIKALRARRA
jgi:hypothetical protein